MILFNTQWLIVCKNVSQFVPCSYYLDQFIFIVVCFIILAQDLKSKLDHGHSLKSELNKHILNLPDLHLLPDMTNFGLDPLPTVGDLFG